MAITISGENNNDRILASDGVLDSISGINAAGIVTATSFTGDLTGDVTGNLTGNVTGNINNSTLLLQTGGYERLRIHSNGHISTGVNNNSYEFTIGGLSGGPTLWLRDSTTSGAPRILFGDTSAALIGGITYNNSSNHMEFATNGSEKLRIASGGDVTVNTGTLYIPQWISHVGDTDSKFGFLQPDIIEFQVAGTQRLKIMNTGEIRIDQATSANNGIRMRPSGWSYDFRMGAVSSSGGSIWLGQNYEPTGGTRDSNTYGTNYLRFTTQGEILLGTGATDTNPTERMKIKSDGKVLIGGTLGLGGATSSPSGLLHAQTSSGEAEVKILGATNGVIQLSGYAGNSTINFGDSSSDTPGRLQYNHGNDSFHIRTGSNNRFHIMGNGDYGFNDSSPTANASGNDTVLSIKGKGSSYSGKIDFKDSSGNIDNHIASDNAIFMFNCDPNSQNGNTAMLFSCHGSERLRIKANGDLMMGNASNPGNTLRYFDVYNTNTGTSAGAIVRLLTTKSDGSSSAGLDIVKYKSGGAYIINNENVGADTGFIAFNTGSSGISPATHMKIAGNGEVVISPRNGGASNNRTSIHFNNVAHTPFIAFKSNNLTEAAYLRVPESSGGAEFNFQTKNTSGTLLSRLTLKNDGTIFTHQLAGNEKGYPLVMGTGTVANNTNMSGSINMHDINGVHTSGGANYHIGGWVFLGNDQAAAPYPVRRFKIFKPGAFSNGTIVYQVWHDGDSNYYYGGLWEIRLNLWTDGDIEGVSLRCVNGYRDDLRVFAYNDSNGIMVQPSSIWGRMFIRRFGYDDGGRNPNSTYCAVANNGALAIYNSQGTDDGTMPTSGSPVELYSFDGTSGSAGATHTGGYNIENAAYFDG